MTDLAVRPSGLLVPASLAGGAAKPSVEHGEHGQEPSVPDGFKRDLEAYGHRWGKKYRTYWMRRYGCWSIQVLQSNGQWAGAVLVFDAAQRTDANKYPFRELDRRAIEDLYAADLWQRWQSGNPDADFDQDMAAKRAAAEAAQAVMEREGDRFFDEEVDNDYAMRLLEAARERGLSVDGNGQPYVDGFRVNHQVPRTAPVG